MCQRLVENFFFIEIYEILEILLFGRRVEYYSSKLKSFALGKILQRGVKGLPDLKSDENVNFSHLTSKADVFHQDQINLAATFPFLHALK